MILKIAIIIFSGVLGATSSYVRAGESFNSIATNCALQYEVNIDRSEREEIDSISGNASLDLIEFLLIFPEYDRIQVALAWIECLVPQFENTQNGNKIYTDAIVSDNRTQFPDLTNRTLEVDAWLDEHGENEIQYPFSVSNKCDMQVSWEKRSGLGFTWGYQVVSEYGSSVLRSFSGINMSPKNEPIGAGNYYLIISSKRDAGQAKLDLVTRCR